jgi:hypothetical protein
MIVRTIEEKDLDQIVQIHKNEYLTDHFTSIFPLFLLKKYYKCLIEYNQYCFLAEIDSKIVGAGIAGDKTKYAIKFFIKRNFILLALVLLLNPRFILKKAKDFHTIFINKNNFQSKATMRYLTFVVRNEYKGQGVAKAITIKIEQEMKKDGVKYYGHSIKHSNYRSTEVMVKSGSVIEYQNSETVMFIKYL